MLGPVSNVLIASGQDRKQYDISFAAILADAQRFHWVSYGLRPNQSALHDKTEIALA